MLGGYFMLQLLNLVANKFDHFARLHDHHMIVVLSAIELKHRVSAFEIVPRHEPSRLELSQYSIDGGQTNIFPLTEELFVYVLCAHMPQFGVLKDFQNLEARERDFESGLTKFFSLLHGGALRGMMRAYYGNVAEQNQL